MLILITLSGCAYLNVAVGKAADVEDKVNTDATFVICRAVSIGAWIRAYGNNAEKAAAWRTLCTANPQTPVK